MLPIFLTIINIIALQSNTNPHNKKYNSCQSESFIALVNGYKEGLLEFFVRGVL